MKNFVKKFVLVLAVFLICVGFIQLSESPYLLVDTLTHCCENHVCNEDSCHLPSTAKLYSLNCETTTFTCRDCMDAQHNNICDLISYYYEYCKLRNGHKYSNYYGEEFPLSSAYITGPETLSSGEDGNFVGYFDGGIPTYNYQWWIYYPCQSKSDSQNDQQEETDQLPCGTWNTLGVNSLLLIRSDTRDFNLKLKVIDGHSDYIFSNTIEITITEQKSLLAKQKNEELKSNNTQNYFDENLSTISNYPNPFNPSTTINYTIGKDSYVSLKIYNSVGEEISNIINQYMTRGTYRSEFSGGNFASGIYIVVLSVDNSLITKKILLVK